MLEKSDLAIEPHIDELVETRRYLHRHPEVSGQEYKTTEFLAGLLKRHQLPFRICEDNRGLIVDLGDPGALRRLAIRGDIDAIPVNDTKTVEYHSRNPNVMHACGHDAHPTMVFGALILLKRWLEKNDYRDIAVRGIFQTEEEVAVGAQRMIRQGALDNVSAIIASHVDPNRPVGCVGLRSGPNTAHCDEVTVTIHGKGGHAARPHETIDPINAGVQFVNSVYGSVNRTVNSQMPVVLTFGQFSGGDCSNVIPDEVHLQGTLRSADSITRQQVIETVGRIANGVSVLTGTQISIEFGKSVPAVVCDVNMTELVRSACADLLGETQVSRIERPSMGGEDFAFYTEKVPASFIRLGSAGHGIGHLPLHNSGFDIDEGVLPIGAKVMAVCAMEYLTANEIH